MHQSREQRGARFFDGGGAGEPPDHDGPLRIVLERHLDRGVESFSLGRAVGYDDRWLGGLLVPADTRFRTDLTSVPWLFTWLVPRTGRHLPAALLHDGLVGGSDDPPSYVSEEGHVVARDEADRVFRDAMGDLGTGTVRRWLVWAAVAVATIFVGSRAWSQRRWWHYRVAAVVTIGIVVVLGTLATLDLVDAGVRLPWMGERTWPLELLGGFAGAVAIPSLLALTWGRFRVAGAISGVSLALLLHVSVALLLLTGLYQVAERLVRRAPRVATVVAATVVVGSLVLLVGLAVAQ
jgi:hypothetical protein